MKLNSIFSFLVGVGLLGSGAMALAQTAAPSATPFKDAHPYLSQTIFRLTGTKAVPGMFEVIPAVSVGEFKYRLPGNPALLTETNTALLYDKRNPLPAITAAGVNYTFFEGRTPAEGNTMATASADGSFVYKGKVPFTPKVVGGNYFTTGTDDLVLVDSYGFFFNTFTKANNIRLIGGNFFIDASGFLTTIKSIGKAPGDGVGMATRMGHVNFSDALNAGGNYFVKADGSLVTIASETGFFSAPYIQESRPVTFGGNYFIAADGILYTISANGNLLKNTAYVIKDQPILVAYSFLKLTDGSFIMVDGNGNPHKTLMHVSTTGVQAAVVKKLPENIDPKSLFQINRKQ